LIAIGLALVIIVFLYQPVKVEGTSMAPLLTDQERIFINKFVYRFEAIQRGDVVVFWYPLDRSKSFIKRVVALPGETIEIRRGVVYVNGQVVAEPYVPPRFADVSDYGPSKVPDGMYLARLPASTFTVARCSHTGLSITLALYRRPKRAKNEVVRRLH
jgi:signal peptidase I